MFFVSLHPAGGPFFGQVLLSRGAETLAAGQTLGVPSWLTTAISVVLFLGASAAYLRGSRDKGTIATLERSNAALVERVGLVESDNVKLRQELELVKQQNITLKDVVTGRQAIESLTTQVSELGTNLGRLHANTMEAILAASSKLHDDLGQLHHDLIDAKDDRR